MEFFATCAAGFEHLLAEELSDLGIRHVRPLKGQVAFEGTQADAYKACLWSHLASRVVAVLGRVDAHNADTLYAGLADIAWEEQLGRGTPFSIDAHGTNAQLRNTQFVALRSKDAVVDRIAAKTGVRPQTDPSGRGLQIVVRISRDRATVGIDLVGEPLFRRGYEASRSSQPKLPPLRADYAAALLMMGGWHRLCQQEGAALVAPYVGAGALAVEAAQIALGMAPGLLRQRWGFAAWAQHDSAAWDRLLAEAQQHVSEQTSVRLLLSDTRPGFDVATRQALRAAGIAIEPLFFGGKDTPPLSAEHALLACDLSWVDQDALAAKGATLARLAQVTEALGAQDTAAVLTLDELPDMVLQEPEGVVHTLLGRDEATLRLYQDPASHDMARVSIPNAGEANVLLDTSEQFAKRLAKVYKQRRKWASREDVSCYRIYDADLPDYAASIDLFEGSLTPGRWLQIYEYAPPKGIDETKAQARLLDIVSLAPRILGVKPEDTFVRVRTKARGGSQYADEAQRLDRRRPGRGRPGRTPLPPGAHLIDEGGLTFEVNFQTRLDCGIFLDHRDTRAMLREMAKETKGSKRFLNLFAYTGTGTCYAADGGARYTTTVDLSAPSLEWAQRNMERNGFSGPEHEYVQADVLAWVTEQRHTKNRWDLVFCDVPTFSNSRRMRKASFDVQRDHTELLIGVSRLLTRDGVCVFSCNLRTFKIDVEGLAKAGVVAQDITADTIPEDFSRNPRIHHCYLIRRG